MYKDYQKIYSFKASIRNRVNGKEDQIQILVENQNYKKTYTLEQLPDLAILEEDFGSEPITLTVLFENVPIRKTIWSFEKITEKAPEAIQEPQTNEKALLEFMKLQEQLTNARIQSLEELQDLKTAQLKEFFKESLENQREMFKERLEWEKELQNSQDPPEITATEKVLLETFSQISPKIGSLIDAFISYMGQPKTIQKIIKPLRPIK